VNSIRAGIAIVNSDLVVEKANSSFLDTFGLEATRAVGAPLTYLDIDIIDEMVVEKIFAIFRRESEFHSQVSRSRTGKVFELRLYPFYSAEGEIHEASGCVFMVDDISARTELEEKIFQAEKLSTISMLSAGMAHEINNPLGSILTNVQNLIEEESSPERRVSLKWIEQETRRIARIVQELLNFASAGSGHAPGSDVNDVVQGVVGLMARSLGREDRIRIDTKLAPGLPPSVVSTDELRQVVINLLRNSMQAIPAEGRIVVSTRLTDDSVIALAVADTGTGIPKEIIPRIFDPFFTTKGNREGTGLGLSVVYGIVSKYRGSIDVRSREGQGTRISLHLPGAPATGRGAA
jgi:PAS domain S-box-containing protein